MELEVAVCLPSFCTLLLLASLQILAAVSESRLQLSAILFLWGSKLYTATKSNAERLTSSEYRPTRGPSSCLLCLLAVLLIKCPRYVR